MRGDAEAHQVIDKASRDWLRRLRDGPIEFRAGRTLPAPVVPLIQQGLAFRSALFITITSRGEDVAERGT